MAVTIEADDLIAPKGNLQAIMFPDGDLEDNLEEWIAQATAKVTAVAESDQNEAVTQWVYHRAYLTIAERIASQPSSESYSGSPGTSIVRGWGQNRADYWEEKAAAALQQFNNFFLDNNQVPIPYGFFGLARGQRGR